MVAVALTEPQGEPPRAKPLRLPDPPAGQPATPARELPNGREAMEAATRVTCTSLVMRSSAVDSSRWKPRRRGRDERVA